MSIEEPSPSPVKQQKTLLANRSHFRQWQYGIGAILALAAAISFLFWRIRPPVSELRMTAGDFLGKRHQIATLLAHDMAPRNVHIHFVETNGSATALQWVSKRQLDIAMVQGGIEKVPYVQEVAALGVEPLHLLVKKELAPQFLKQGSSLQALRHKRVNLSTRGSGTRQLATQVLAFADLAPGRDFEEENASYKTLEQRAYVHLPDALFTVSLMPSPVVTFLVRRHGYVIVPIPFAHALSLQNPALHETTIPAFTYGVTPSPTPPQDIVTIGTQLLLVARDDLNEDLVVNLLETIFAGNFAREAALTDLSESRFLAAPEMSIHRGAIAYRDRNLPIVTGDFVQSMEDAKSLIVSVVVTIFFGWRWWRQRQYFGFDRYLKEVTRIEKLALELEMKATPSIRTLMDLRNELGAMKTEALEKFARRELRGEELMSAFLTHVADVRGYLSALILSERERIAEGTRDTIPDDEQEARFREQWSRASRAEKN